MTIILLETNNYNINELKRLSSNIIYPHTFLNDTTHDLDLIYKDMYSKDICTAQNATDIMDAIIKDSETRGIRVFNMMAYINELPDDTLIVIPTNGLQEHEKEFFIGNYQTIQLLKDTNKYFVNHLGRLYDVESLYNLNKYVAIHDKLLPEALELPTLGALMEVHG